MDSDLLVVISSDGHAGALMAQYRPYLDNEYLEDFDRFLIDWNERGSRNFDPPALQKRLDPQFVQEWTEKMVDTGRLEGFPDPVRRLSDMENEGVVAEVLFPDFGVPFELYSPSLAASKGHILDEPHKRAGKRAYNRWLVDYMSVAPERFAGMASISWQYSVEDTVEEIIWAHRAGFKGIVLPEFDPTTPLYHPMFEPIWQILEDLEMIVNSHAGMSSTSNKVILTPALPHPALEARIRVPEFRFFCHNILSHLIWGGVLERHPTMKCVFTEQGSSWVVDMLSYMDYVYQGSYYRTDYQEEVIQLKPSEYFERQCFLGSSLFSRAEIAARDEIGINKMMIGMDFPHHEGTLLQTTKEYLRATLGASHVSPDEARMLLGSTAASVFGFDVKRLTAVASRVALKVADVLTPPESDLFPRGDVHRPFTGI